jgi:hypothetical protein
LGAVAGFQFLKALYYPYTDPGSYETVLRSLLIHEEIGVIIPERLFLTNQLANGRKEPSTVIEYLDSECKKYDYASPFFALDPVDLIGENETAFTESVISDMSDSDFVKKAPQGEMVLYGDKLTSPILERFRDKISAVPSKRRGSLLEFATSRKDVEVCYYVSEPLAYSILLNLTLLGANQSSSVPFTDSVESHKAFLAKMSARNSAYEMRVASSDLLRIVLPSAKGLDIRRILDFRDKYQNEMRGFWKALEEEQTALEEQFSGGTDKLYVKVRFEFENLQNALKSADETLKWSVPVAIGSLIIGLAGHSQPGIAGSPLAVALGGIRYYKTARSTGASGLSYLLRIQDKLA